MMFWYFLFGTLPDQTVQVVSLRAVQDWRFTSQQLTCDFLLGSVPHCAIMLPGQNIAANPRESIEMRFLIFTKT